ncbi:amidohydrolase family protein [Amphiplicatus metriothermophilus]|uniref:Imidazolonepropionase n=1 Tax=Amphiplicatus metriothermophilus TaxID=1519374 RepID=A0A239PK90_9PROT|nr:amidohydrolase family protein [Amphiplicatus metriothermophilus]MBB5517433.1 imidazolonepropionase-like amidohydrolase [Amphiplicatus metriothermophilus]SNT68232.1 Imidazolonepropionase [Amphiplicatus metriothermophilus]
MVQSACGTLKRLAGAALAFAVALAPAAAQTIFIDNARLYTMGPQGLIENGDVLVRNGVIAAVGANLEAPEGASVIDAAGRVVTPGFFAPYSQLGLVEIGLDREANDAGPRGEFPLSAALDALDAYNPSSSLIAINRAGGVTRALAAPEPGDKLFAGRAAVVDLSGRVASVTKPQAAQVVAMGYAGARRAGDTRMGALALLRSYLDEAISYRSNPRDYVMRARGPAFALADLRALGPVVAGEQLLLVHANSASDIRALLRIKNDYRLKMAIVGGAEAWRVARELAAADAPVILDPTANLPFSFEMLGSTLANAARLHGAGVRIAFLAPDTHNLRLLPQMAGNAVANGLPYEAALAALTINAAAIYGLESRLGSIEAGKAADLVVWDGDPLEVTARPAAVLIDGRAMSLDNRQTRLRDRYRDLSRGDLPHAYRGEN